MKPPAAMIRMVALLPVLAAALPGQGLCAETALATQPAPSTAPATAPTPVPAWESELVALTARLRNVQAVSGRFVQTRYTPMLRKPMVSSGTIRMAGALMRWDTEKPARSVLLITPSDARVYLPDQSLLEIYPVDAQAMGLAGSPAPRLDKLRAQFEISAEPSADPGILAIVLQPREQSLREHVSEVHLQIDRGTALLRQMEIINPDGERLVTQFQGMQTRPDIQEKDLALTVPKGTKISRPLEGTGGVQ